MINNSDIYDTYKDLFLSEKEATSRHTVGQRIKSKVRCKKSRWHGTDSDNSRKCN